MASGELVQARFAALLNGAARCLAAAQGLPVGSAFVDFALPTVAGGTMTLSQWWGQRVVLIFFDPRSNYCRRMLPALAQVEPDPEDARPVPLVVSTGDPEANRRLMATYGVRCPVMLQEHDEVARRGWVEGTPMGYLLDEQGATAGPLAVGAQAVLALAGGPPLNGTGMGLRGRRSRNGSTPYAVATQIRPARGGLPVGTVAPGFRLPRVDGGELALDELRGQRVLLVFSDPSCDHCARLPMMLETVKAAPGLSLLIVSRGGAAANRQAGSSDGRAIPVVLQRHWEISHAYGMLATPIAYLIDEAGIIAAPVAVGSDAILALASISGVSARGCKGVVAM